MTNEQTIVSFYKFTSLTDLANLRKKLKSLCHNHQLGGTIILADEGVNAMLAGSQEGIEALINFFKADPRFAEIAFKVSVHQGSAFRRMLVKIKKQCLTFRAEADPRIQTGKRLAPLEFKRWLDEGREMLVLDTRNDYEVAAGTFAGAIDPHLKNFAAFSQWITTNLGDAKDRTIVTFCTGGIRCEKATAFMQAQGFTDVYQLDGGIITYLGETQQSEDDNYWRGECIVFDKRHAVDHQLRASTKQHCFVCLTSLSDENTADETFPAGSACTTCAETIHLHRKKRHDQGLAQHRKNLQVRREYIAQQRKKHAKTKLG